MLRPSRNTRPRGILPLLTLVLAGPVVLAGPFAAAAEETIDWQAVSLLRDEGFNRSQLPETLRHLTDTIGPRLTGSPQLRAANEWTRDRLTTYGLANARLEPWGEFGRGWTYERATLHVVRPRATSLFAIPLAWTPGTGEEGAGGALRGVLARATLDKDEDQDTLRGQLRGKILLLDEERRAAETPPEQLQRYDDRELEDIARYDFPGDREDFRRRQRERFELQKKRNQFLVDEGVLATLQISEREAGIVRVGGGGSRLVGDSTGVPALVVAAEQYNWLVRLVEGGTEVEVELDVAARFFDDDLQAYNTVAELPGTDRAHELVMIGGHLDSWHPAAGSNDNAAGCAVAIEAVRLLKATGLVPRRTVRIALWTGEEQGLLGSRAYVARHFARRPPPEDPELARLPPSLWPLTWPIEYLPEHSRLAAYFNLDNGSGRIRGVYTQNNVAVVPIFERWLTPFHDLGARTITNNDTGGTDHLAFDAVGLPGFQFIQDELDYSTRTHHTHLDHYDHARIDDLKQAAVIMASFVYHAAMRDQPLPREARPQPPPAPAATATPATTAAPAARK